MKINQSCIAEKGSRTSPELKQERGALSRTIRGNAERGVALVVVLVLSAVSLALITALLYMITVGTQTSGMQKRYRTALEASIAGSDLMFQIIEQRGDNTAITSLLNGWTSGGISSAPNIPDACQGTSYVSGAGEPVTKLAAKNMTSATTWNTSCSKGFDVDSTSYDYKFQVGTTTRYTVYAKITDLREGNTGVGSGSGATSHHLVLNPVVGSGGGEIPSPSIPYLYEIEMSTENNANPQEKAKISILYQY